VLVSGRKSGHPLLSFLTSYSFGWRMTGDMDPKQGPFQVAILLYPGVSALDAVGPWEVLSRMPNTGVRFVAKEVGPVVTEGGTLFLGVTHTLAETPALLVPGGTTTPGQMLDDEVLAWLRKAHETTTWTTSDCTGSLKLTPSNGMLKWRDLGNNTQLIFAGRHSGTTAAPPRRMLGLPS
jgi:putative intracellular protease/amidase